MTSDLDDQQLSSMQSTSEFGDSRKELRQIECCVHGRPCAIASKLSRAMKEEADRDTTGNQYNVPGSGYENVFEKRKSPLSRDDVPIRMRKKVEREALDVPVSKWNLNAPQATFSNLSFEPVALRLAGVEQPLATSNVPEKKTKMRRKVERQSLDASVDANFMTKIHSEPISQEKHNGYEMMNPISPPRPSASIPGSAEQAARTAQTIASTEPTAPSVEAYIGVMSPRQAEEQVIKPTSFKLYHMMPKIESLNNVLPSLGLYVIYRSGKGRVYHYPIKECKQYVDYPKSKLSPVTNLQVEYGDPLAPRFFNLDALVSYYNIYVHLREVDGECVADIFPINGVQANGMSYRRVR